MNVVTIAIGDLFDFEGQALPAVRPDEETILAMVKRQFSFLPQPLQIDVGDKSVTVSFVTESASAQQESTRLAERAGKQAAAGEFTKAISLLKRVLDLRPAFHQARRDLAMSCLEIGDIDSAKNHLIEVLRLNPGDAWSWVVLGNIYAKNPKDWPTAETFLRRALEIAPGDPWALNGLATIAGQRGQTDEAVRLFQQAIASKPELPNAHYGLAVAYHRSDQPDPSLRALDDLFAKARAQDARSRPVFEQARQLYAELQSARAERQHPEAFKAVENLRAELEQASGYPVRVTEGEFKDTTGAIIQMAWKHGRDHHLVTLRKSLPEHLRTHFTAHELIHLQLETEARKAGKNRFFITTDKTEEAAAQRIQGGLRKLERRGHSERAVRDLVQMWVRGIANFLFNCPLDMVIETRLRERMPALAAAQFVSTRMSVSEALQSNTNAEIREITPPVVLRASLALNGAFTLFLDHLYQGATNYAAHYQREESFALAQRLFRHWQIRSPQLGPGDEYALVDEFADMLGLRGWFDWRLDLGTHEIAPPAETEGSTNPGLLRTKQPAAVHYLLDALKRYDTLPVEKIREIAFEIGVVGQRGLDYASPDQKYDLKSLPDEKFSGLHLMCLMYAGFKRIAPEHDLHMDLHEPFLKALELFQGAKGELGEL
jgi:Flp pilus assembly protein TadD